VQRITLVILLFLAAYANPAFADTCHGPPSRLSVDSDAVVAADALSLRALPSASTGVAGRLYRGNALRVIGGPSCNGLYTWWRVETSGGMRGWVAEGAWENYYVVPAADAADPPTPFDVACLLTFSPLYCL
jgi:uncharacterized protein YgiM (DUF1202 family)